MYNKREQKTLQKSFFILFFFQQYNCIFPTFFSIIFFLILITHFSLQRRFKKALKWFFFNNQYKFFHDNSKYLKHSFLFFDKKFLISKKSVESKQSKFYDFKFWISWTYAEFLFIILSLSAFHEFLDVQIEKQSCQMTYKLRKKNHHEEHPLKLCLFLWAFKLKAMIAKVLNLIYYFP